MKLSEYVANWIALYFQPEDQLEATAKALMADSKLPQLDVMCRIYAVCGAGAMHLNDSICNHPGIDVIPMQHEQGAAYAAECEARVTNNLSVVHVTVGPGGSNTITGVACAFVDSIPMLVIAGQVTQSQSSLLAPGKRKLRQAGLNELDMVGLMQPITKMAITVTDPMMIRYYLEKATYTAMHGRRGPVFLEIPLDVQASDIDGEKLTGFNKLELEPPANHDYIEDAADAVAKRLKKAKRPVLIYGNGVRLAGAEDELLRVIDELDCPIISSWSASDIIPSSHPNYLGRCGLFGDVASNYAVQNADVVLGVGTRLSPAQIGHHAKHFAPSAYKIVVDIDVDEAYKESIKADFPIVADAKAFLSAFKPQKCSANWLRTRQLAKKHDQKYDGGPNRAINSYDFVNFLQKHMEDDAVVVTDVGFSFIPVFQRLELKQGQRLIHSCGVSPMGYAIPAAIGAKYAAGEKRQVVCLTGDGGAMLNIQELHTISQRGVPMAIFVFANEGYATMRIAQKNHFKREAISGPESDNPITAEELSHLGMAFGLPVINIQTRETLHQVMPYVMKVCKETPIFCVMQMPPDQVIAPRVQAKIVDGKFAPATLTDMWFPETENVRVDA